MIHWILFLHIVGAVMLGFYFLMPLLVAGAGKLSGAAEAGYAGVLRKVNRIAQFGLLFEFLTGGYLMSQYKPSTLWLILVLVFIVALGAVSGILGSKLKKLGEAAEAGGGDAAAQRSSSTVLSWLSALFLLVIIFLMNNTGMFGQ